VPAAGGTVIACKVEHGIVGHVQPEWLVTLDRNTQQEVEEQLANPHAQPLVAVLAPTSF
jgi:hypothetical protein